MHYNDDPAMRSPNRLGFPKSRDDGGLGIHTENLFDQDTDEYGNTIDVTTGLPYDNSTETDVTAVIEILGARIVDISRAPSTLDRNDPAAKWLAEYDSQQAA